MVSYQKEVFMSALGLKVLILVVVDNGLVLSVGKNGQVNHSASLNPCCSGQWSRTNLKLKIMKGTNKS